MTRAALYCRVSSDQQAREGDSIPAQLAALHAYADQHEYVVVGEYIDDGISGTKYTDRDELQRLLNDVSKGKIDLIIFTRLDRWFRSVRHYLNTQELLDKHGVVWKAIWESYETETPQGRFQINMMMSVAELEAQNTGSRVRQVFNYKVSQGEVISGSVPAGYSIEDKHLVVNEYADSVRTAFETYARCGSMKRTMRECQDLPGLPRGVYTFRNMLKNRLYVGEYRGNHAYCPPIIDRDLFEEVQVNLSKNVKASQKHPYLFTGMIRCAECGRLLSGGRRMYERGGPYYVYRCQKHYAISDPCPNTKVIQENVLERQLLERIRPEMEGIVMDAEEKKRQIRKVDTAKIRKKLERLKDLYVNGLIDLDEYRKDRESLTQALQTPVPAPDVSKAKKLLGMDFEALYGRLDALGKRRFWRAAIREIRWTMDREVIVDWY